MVATTETEAFADRLRRALAAQGVRASPTLVAREFNARHRGKDVTPFTARHWLQGQAMPTQDKLVVLADWLQVSPDALRFGPRASSLRGALGDAQLQSLELADRELIDRYRALPAPLRKTVRDVVAAMSACASSPSSALPGELPQAPR